MNVADVHSATVVYCTPPPLPLQPARAAEERQRRVCVWRDVGRLRHRSERKQLVKRQTAYLLMLTLLLEGGGSGKRGRLPTMLHRLPRRRWAVRRRRRPVLQSFEECVAVIQRVCCCDFEYVAAILSMLQCICKYETKRRTGDCE